ncbi:MAG: PLP-dependent aminotransferase family protein, partial [Deinococcota bacterium]
RFLAKHLGVSRNTVLEALDQLLAEGYLEARRGAGTFIAVDVLASTYAEIHQSQVTGGNADITNNAAQDDDAIITPKLSSRGQRLAASKLAQHQDEARPLAFQPGLSALDLFPWKLWMRLANQAAKLIAQPNQHQFMGYGNSAGLLELRQALAEHLRVARGVRCQPEDIVITTGTQQAVDLTARLLLDVGDPVWVENPGYTSGHEVLRALGAELIPGKVDAEGLELPTTPVRLAYLTPSHQYPLGVTMSLGRRLAFLEAAKAVNMWLFEDDYDSEFRYAGKPLAALQSLDAYRKRVIYAGTLSKVLYPGLRLGYMVLPPILSSAFVSARGLADRSPPLLAQKTLALFITGGHFTRHIRKMRHVYDKRRQALINALEQIPELSRLVSDTGLQLSVRLSEGWDDRALSVQLTDAGIEARPLSDYAHAPLGFGGLNLGYAAVDESTIVQAAETMKKVVEAYANTL